MLKRLVLLMLLVLAPMVSLQGSEKGEASQGTPPFLIMGKMPHFTKTIKQHWDDEKLGLDEAQKKALLAVRKETISEVQRISALLQPLENAVAKNALAGMGPKEQGSDVAQIARLKTEATMTHLECIYKTRAILTPAQYAYLLSL